MQNIIEKGKHILTCVEDIRFERWGDELDGLYIVLDGKEYLAYRDPDDGYRSYGVFEEVGDIKILTKIINKFPPQEVYFTETREKIREQIAPYVDELTRELVKSEFRNENGELILGVYTDYADDYYPVGYVEYHPENLPENKETTTWYATI